MKKILTIVITGSFLLGIFFSFPSCKKKEDPLTLEQALGWFGLGGENGDDLAGIEDDINFGQGEVPASVNLSSHFPPIGDQGQYGTCVAWAVGYNHKSYMDAAAADRTTFNNDQKFSPKYLFWKIPSSQKGADCNGTGFEPAYDIMLSYGISNLATSPYSNLGDCSSSPSSSENTNAANYKIQSYREVEVDKNTLKQYLAQERALSFGAKLGDNFMSWNSSDVHYSDTYGYSGQHAYHAMTLCGYDDNKGTNGAFRVVNSWGTGWGDSGYIWVDYNFFVNEFAFCAFAATNIITDPDNEEGEGNGVVDDPNSGKDLMAWELYDYDNGGGTNRVAKYNAFNSGSEDILASEDWNILYIYYNAYDANDYGIILYDYYSDDNTGGTWTYGGNGDLFDDGDGIGNWWNWVDAPAGYSIAYDVSLKCTIIKNDGRINLIFNQLRS